MHIGGIIAEYDPFHNGHKAHIDSFKEAGATHIVAVLSGSFTQRGEPAALTKFDRARMAVAGGVDLVLENPLPFAMASAERFATGGVGILQALGCVNTLSFGSECGDIERLTHLADILNTATYQQHLQAALSDGIPYAAATQQAVSPIDDTLAPLLAMPNNTLGIEYIRAAKRLGCNFTFHTLTRIGALHNDLTASDSIASAGYIRTQLREAAIDHALLYIPSEAQYILNDAMQNGQAPADGTALHGALLSKLRSMTTDDFAALPYISEGLDNRLYRASRTAGSYNDLLEAVKTRRYPTARIRRILWAALLGMPAENRFPHPVYIRVLAMNAKGKDILTAAKPTLPILTRAAQIPSLSIEAKAMLALEERATDLHALTLPRPLPCGTDWTHKL